jgi:hypothetical protein
VRQQIEMLRRQRTAADKKINRDRQDEQDNFDFYASWRRKDMASDKKLQLCHAEGAALSSAPLFATEESQCWRTDASLR